MSFVSHTHTPVVKCYLSGKIKVCSLLSWHCVCIRFKVRPGLLPRGLVSLTHTEPLCVGLCCGLASSKPTAQSPEQAAYYMEECTDWTASSQAAAPQAHGEESTAKMYLRRKLSACVSSAYMTANLVVEPSPGEDASVLTQSPLTRRQ